MKRLSFIWLLPLLIPIGCKHEFPVPQDKFESLSVGTGDFTKVMSLGGAWSAGLIDGALHTNGQQSSFPNLIIQTINRSNKFDLIFEQPLVNNQLGLNYYEDPSVVAGPYFIEFIRQGSSISFKNYLPGETLNIYTGSAPVQNISFPGAKVFQYTYQNLMNNIYFSRFSDTQTNTLSKHVDLFQPSIVLVQLGMEDILNYAMHGMIDNPNPDPNDIGINDLTPIDVFEASIRIILSHLHATGADVFVGNIPNFIEFPFFQEIGHLAHISGSEAEDVTDFYSDHNNLVNRYNSEQGSRILETINFFSDDSPLNWTIVVEDPALSDAVLLDGTTIPKYRKLVEGEKVLWSISEFPSPINKEGTGGLGLQFPITKEKFLTRDETLTLRQLIVDYNNIIETVSKEFSRIELVDIFSELNAEMNEIIVFNGVSFEYTMQRSGIFSADGINLNQRGQALLTNAYVKIMNNKYRATIPFLDPNDYPGNIYRNAF